MEVNCMVSYGLRCLGVGQISHTKITLIIHHGFNKTRTHLISETTWEWVSVNLMPSTSNQPHNQPNQLEFRWSITNSPSAAVFPHWWWSPEKSAMTVYESWGKFTNKIDFPPSPGGTLHQKLCWFGGLHITTGALWALFEVELSTRITGNIWDGKVKK